MDLTFGTMRPRTVEAIGRRLYGEDWRPSLASLLGMGGCAATTGASRTGSLGMLVPGAEAALSLRLVLTEIVDGRLEPTDIRDIDAFMAALKRALRIEQRTPCLPEDAQGFVLRALARALAATRLNEEDIDRLIMAARAGIASEPQLRAAINGCPSVHEAAEAMVVTWNRELTRHPGRFLKDGGCLFRDALDQVGRTEMRPLPEVAERLSWYAGVYDVLYRCEDEQAWRWAYEQLADGTKAIGVEAELLRRGYLPALSHGEEEVSHSSSSALQPSS